VTNRRRQKIESLEELRELWEAEGDLAYLWQALSCADGVPLPDWLAEALKQNLEAVMVTPRECQQRMQQNQTGRIVHAVRDAIHGGCPYPYFYAADNEKASEPHFRAAAERLSAEGLVCSPQSVKKAWQRHKPLPYEQALALILEDPD